MFRSYLRVYYQVGCEERKLGVLKVLLLFNVIFLYNLFWLYKNTQDAINGVVNVFVSVFLLVFSINSILIHFRHFLIFFDIDRNKCF